MAKSPLDKFVKKSIKDFDNKIKTSFILIRQDIEEIKNLSEAMRKYLKKKDKQYTYAKKEDNKIRDAFRKDVDEFDQKISQLKLALDAVRQIQKTVVMVKDLAQIEDRIKNSFKQDIESYKGQVKNLRLDLKESEKRISCLEKGKVREKKTGWFGLGKRD